MTQLTDAQIQHKLAQNPLLAQLHAIAMRAVDEYEDAPPAAFDSQEFYELCQAYRHAPITSQTEVCERFQAMIDYGNAALARERAK